MWDRERAKRLGKGQEFVSSHVTQTCVLGWTMALWILGKTGSPKPWPWGSVARLAERGEDDHEGHLCGPPPRPEDGRTSTVWTTVDLASFTSFKPDN